MTISDAGTSFLRLQMGYAIPFQTAVCGYTPVKMMWKALGRELLNLTHLPEIPHTVLYIPDISYGRGTSE